MLHRRNKQFADAASPPAALQPSLNKYSKHLISRHDAWCQKPLQLMPTSHHLLQLLHQLLYLWLINCCSANMAATLLLRLQNKASADLQ
jgi:hypothetical protein